MKLSDNTLNILKGFCAISENLKIVPGDKLSVVSPAGNVLAFADTEEKFVQTATFYQLSSFLDAINVFENPDFEFKDDFVEVKDESSTSYIRYYYGDPELIKRPKSTPKYGEELIEFDISARMWHRIYKLSTTLDLPHLTICNDEGELCVVITDKTVSNSNRFRIPIGDELEADFFLSFTIEQLKFLPGDYRATVTDGNFVKFALINSDSNVDYYVSWGANDYYNSQ